jgi:CubicO group peptidase (beta-lactamase class C family)
VQNPALTKRLYANPFQYFSTAYQLSLAVTKPLRYQPGTSWSYAHTNFVLLGLALEKITGRPLATLIRNRILRPLGLRNTFSSDKPYITPPVLQGYDSERGVYEDATYWNPSWTLAHGAIMTSNIYDVGRTAIAIGTGRLLSRKYYREMIAPRSLISPPGQPKAYYGLGLFLDNGWIIQNPLLPGYGGIFAYLPSARVTIAVASTPGKHSEINHNYSTDIARALSRYLVPNQPIRTSAGPG